MTDTDFAPVILLYTRGRKRIEGTTRFQKLVFLLQEETDTIPKYSYRADKFGPFSPDLAMSLDALIRKGYIERDVRTNEAGNGKYVYSLTNEGIRLGQSLVRKDAYNSLFKQSERVKKRYNNWSLDQLLRYLYEMYPGYTTETELDFDRLFDPEADSQFLEQDHKKEAEEYIGPGPGKWKEINSTAEEIFPFE